MRQPRHAIRSVIIVFLAAGLILPPSGASLAAPAAQPLHVATFDPASRAADDAALPANLALKLALTPPDGTLPADPAGSAYDRVNIRILGGFSFDVASVVVGQTRYENKTATFLREGCAFDAAGDYPGWATRNAFVVCRVGDLVNVTLSNPVRSPDALVTIELANVTTPTEADTYEFPVTLFLTANAADSALGLAADLPRNGEVNKQLALFDVTPGAPVRAAFVRSSSALQANETFTFLADSLDQFGNARMDAATYEIVSGSGTIGTSGAFTPDKVGTTTIRAHAGGFVTPPVDVSITPGPLDHFSLTCASPIVASGTSECLAEARDLNDNAREDAPTGWTATAGSVDVTSPWTATWNAPSTAATYTISVSAENATGATSVAVVAGGATSLTVTPSVGTTVPVSADLASFSVTATLRDSAGNLALDGTSVEWSLSDPAPANVGPCVLAANTSTTTNGSATIVVTTSRTPGDDCRVNARYVGTDGVTLQQPSGRHVVRPGSLHHFNVTGAPTHATAGVALGGNVTVLALDAYENRKTDFVGAIQFGSSSARRTVPPNATFTAADSGQKVFAGSGFRLDTAGQQTILVASTANPLLAGASSPITVGPAGLDHAGFLAPPTTTTADTSVDFDAVAMDVYGNARPEPVTFSLVIGSGSIDPTTGVFTANKTGTTTVRASVDGATAADTDIDVTLGALDHVTFTLAPTTTDADTSVTFTAEARDVRDNVRADDILYSLADGAGVVGSESGDFTPTLVGNATIRAAAGATSATAVIRVTPGSIARVVFDAPVATLAADANATFSALASDQHGNAVSTSILFSVQTGSGSIDPSSGLFTPDKAGISRIEARAGAKNATHDVTVTPGALHHFNWTSSPTTTSADDVAQFTATPRDRNDNLLPGVNVTYAVSTGTGSVNATGAFTPEKTGTVTITATADTLVRSRDIIVTPGSPAAPVVTAAPATPLTAGDAFTLTIEVRDAKGNLVPDATNTFTLELDEGASPSGAALVGNTSQVAVDGVASMSDLSLTKAGANVLLVSMSGVTARASLTINVSAGAPAGYALECVACPLIAGEPGALAVRAVDGFGNTNLTFSGDVDLTFSGPTNAITGAKPTCGGAEMGNATAASFLAGVATVDCTLYRVAGALPLAATGGDLASAPYAVPLAPAPASQLVVAAPTKAIAGVRVVFNMSALDAYGNLVAEGPHDVDGARSVTWTGAGVSPSGNAPTAEGTPFGAAATVNFHHGKATVNVTLYERQEAVLVNATMGTLRNNATIQVEPAPAVSLGVLTCDPATGSRACVVASSAVTTTLTLRNNTLASFFAGGIDSYGNVAGRASGAWLGNGTALGLVANGEGVSWLFDEVGQATVRVAHATLGTRTLDIRIIT